MEFLAELFFSLYESFILFIERYSTEKSKSAYTNSILE